MINPRFLLDANLSPETASFLRSLGFDAKSLIEENLGHLEDAEVAEYAQNKGRILITFDLDFGELYYFHSKKKFSVIVLRLSDQRIENANKLLLAFLGAHTATLKKREKILAIVSEAGFRIVR